jgi:tubulin epsilon
VRKRKEKKQRPYPYILFIQIDALIQKAVLIDMEEGVVNQILNDKNLSDLFDARQLLTDVSGAGNNW